MHFRTSKQEQYNNTFSKPNLPTSRQTTERYVNVSSGTCQECQQWSLISEGVIYLH